ncbi:MAG: Arm DNA-binding domain-containing protein, partial [Mesorhizobium sp.]
MPKITKRLVDAIEPEMDEQTLWDSELKGFGVRMMPTGVASYIIKYRTADGRQRKMALGRTTVLTPEQARQLAREHLTTVTTGGDPSAARSQLRKTATVSEVADDYLAAAKLRLKSGSYSAAESNIRV